MAYRVKIIARAQRDLAGIYEWIGAESSDAARMVLGAQRTRFAAWKRQPNRCPVTPENESFRHLLYGHKPHVYRVIYRVLEKQKQVEVLHIRHGARDEFARRTSLVRESDRRRKTIVCPNVTLTHSSPICVSR